MCFLMAMEEDPVRSLSSVMALMIPALYDMVMVFEVTATNGAQGVEGAVVVLVRGARMIYIVQEYNPCLLQLHGMADRQRPNLGKS
jgi:hypothetical protein